MLNNPNNNKSFYEDRVNFKPEINDDTKIIDKYADAYMDGEYDSIEALKEAMKDETASIQANVLLIVG